MNRTVVPARVKTLTSTTEIAIGRVSRNEIRTSRRSDAGDGGRRQDRQDDDRERPEVAAEHERADRLDRRDDRLGQRVEPVVRAWASAGASRARKAASSAEIGRLESPDRRALLQADRLLALREARRRIAGDSVPSSDEHDEEGQRLVDRVGDQALLEDRRLQVGAGPAGRPRRGSPCPSRSRHRRRSPTIGAEMIAEHDPRRSAPATTT